MVKKKGDFTHRRRKRKQGRTEKRETRQREDQCFEGGESKSECQMSKMKPQEQKRKKKRGRM